MSEALLQRIPDEVGYSRKIRKEHVHLTSEAGLIVTEWGHRGDMRFALKAVWPHRDGGVFPAHRGFGDPTVIAQTVRQSGLLIAHGAFGVPLSHQTLLQNLRFQIDQNHSLPYNKPTVLDVEVLCSAAGRRGVVLTGLRLDVFIVHEGQAVAWAEAEFSWVSPVVYHRLRGRHVTVRREQPPLPAPVAPRLVGRYDPADVVLAPTGEANRWLLRTDFGNKAYFDHPVDHVPGLVLVEAAHQAARALSQPVPLEPISVSAGFSQYVEFDEPCWIEAAPVPTDSRLRTAVRVTGHQGGQQAFSTVLIGPAAAS
ncbi:ScbA/BarX family gamma-butyrolactone biosynthesis protein [Kitasatospora sp. NPDC052896]|uniref:ScbA/BarX family gamma-butyrolactone biosynthesis protein n=1 Tax=Kitasatospora sp. NPDC052896 TaxID=3364061 RepID=UPI0037C5BEC1